MPYYGHRDPREGEHPEEADICLHGQLRESCGKCADDEIWDALHDRAAFERELEQTVPVEQRQTLRAMLDRLQASYDEIKGAELAARFDHRGK